MPDPVALIPRPWDAQALSALELVRLNDPWGAVPSAYELFRGCVLFEAVDELGEVGLLAARIAQYRAGLELGIAGAVRTRGHDPIWRGVFGAVDLLADRLDAQVIGLQTMHRGLFRQLESAGYRETGRTFIKDRRTRGNA